jgi:phospholipase D
MWHKKFNVMYQLKRKADFFTFFLALLLGGALSFNPLYSCSNTRQTNIEVCFTPGGQCVRLIERAIAQAQEQIFVQAYFFTSHTIAQALIAARKKGVIVKLLVDRSQLTQQSLLLKNLLKGGISIFLDKVDGVAHNKVMIIDDMYVLTGSYNWTDGAEYKNAENLLLITDRNINQTYKQNWEQRAQKAQAISLKNIERASK